jgi:hypothetical protein
MKNESNRCRKRTNTKNIKGVKKEFAKNYSIQNYDPIAKFKEQFSFVKNPVLPNLSGEYLAFEDLSRGKYRIKLLHIRSGAVFEVLAGISLNAPIHSNPNVPVNPKIKS